MSKTLLAVGPWIECGKVITSALANRWSVLHTLLFEDISVAMEKARVDLILLAGCSSRRGWEGLARGAWEVCRDAPVVALGSDSSQDSLVSALVGTAPHEGEGAAAGGDSDPFASVMEGLRCSRVSPTLRLFEPGPGGASSGIRRALDFIERHYAEPITLADAAREASYSRCHFSKVFKEQSGASFVSYLARVRVRHASRLLVRTSLPVTTVALEVGFNDLSHFERVFRAAHQLSPTKFRAQSKNMATGSKNPPSFLPVAVTS